MRKLNIEEFIEKAIAVHGDKYNYSKSIYKDCKTKIIIICNTCNSEFEQIPDNHVRGKGCNYCAEKLRAQAKRKSVIQFINDAILVHNYKYNYSLITNGNYINKDTKVPIICNACNFIFYQTPGNHLAGNGCPKCFHRISKAEADWLDMLKINANNRQILLKINQKIYKVDAYVPETNTIYEFYGDYWHGNPNKYLPELINERSGKTFKELYDNTINREIELKLAGYNIISMWESDWKKLKQEFFYE